MKHTGKELAALEKKLYEYQGDDRIVSSHELAEELKKTSDAVYQIPTGIPTLDRILNKTEAGELVVVTGPSGHGKTTLLMTITNNMAIQNIKTAWFTLEVTPRQFIKKISSSGDLPLFYLPKENINNNFEWMVERIIEAKVKHDIKAVFIDHIHQIFSLDRMKGLNLSLELADLVSKIKQIAIDYNLVVFLIAHMKDDPLGTKREPLMQDIRDSGMISRLADTVVGVWRTTNSATLDDKKMQSLEETDTKAKVRVFKNRREGKLTPFFMNHENHYLTEIAPVYSKKHQEEQESDEDFESLVTNF